MTVGRLLDPPPFPVPSYSALADRIARLLRTRRDIVFVQGEALLALEAVALGVGRPGIVVLNLVSSQYGLIVGNWMRRTGAVVHDLVSQPGQPLSVETISSVLDRIAHVDLLSLTHGEAATGIVNPLGEIAALAQSRNALLVVDAVASVGGHDLPLDEIDIAVIGPQKALAGPAGLSMVAVSQRGWSHIEGASVPPTSTLSLLALKQGWIDRGRGALPGTPAPLEFWALDQAVARLETEGIEAVIARHRLAAFATRAALRSLHPEGPWITDDEAACTLVTSLAPPACRDLDLLVAEAPHFGVALEHGGAPMRGRLLRIEHMGMGAGFLPVMANMTGFARMLRASGLASADPTAAAAIVAAAYDEAAA